MPEGKEAAKKRAKEHGFKQSQVVKGEDGYYIAPHGIKGKDKKKYAAIRSSGKDAESAARIINAIKRKY